MTIAHKALRIRLMTRRFAHHVILDVLGKPDVSIAHWCGQRGLRVGLDWQIVVVGGGLVFFANDLDTCLLFKLTFAA